jgi:hypothetical protein
MMSTTLNTGADLSKSDLNLLSATPNRSVAIRAVLAQLKEVAFPT